MKQLYFGGDLDASIAISGQVAGRIDAVVPVAQIIAELISGFRAASAHLAQLGSA